MLESSTAKILWLISKSGAQFKWPIPLPKKRKLYTVNTAHFVYKDSREQYERFTYARLIDVTEVWPKTVEQLQTSSIAIGVSLDIKLF